MSKPSNLIYGVDEKPPKVSLLLLGFQHILVNAAGFVILVTVVSGFSPRIGDTENLLRMSMLAVGMGSILQASRIGSGFLCPAISGPSYAAASTLAGASGGFPLLFGMTFLGGLFEICVSRVIPRLRVLFPPHVVGLVVTMVGFEMIPLAGPRFLGASLPPEVGQFGAIMVAGFTLAIMAGCAIWGTGAVRLYPALIGTALGWVASFLIGVVTPADLEVIRSAAWFGFPKRVSWEMSFEWRLLPPFLVASLASTLKTVGDLTVCQKITDTAWKQPDMSSISRGVFTSGITTAVGGLLGTVGHSTSSSNIGLALATGAASRYIGYSFGCLVAALALFPKFAAVFTVLPKPVMGAILVYAACFMVVSGMQVLSSHLMDCRRILVVGIAFIFGVSVELLPQLYTHAPNVLRPLLSSSLSFATILVLVLNAATNIGGAKKTTKTFTMGAPEIDVFTFMEQAGAACGAGTDTVYRAAIVLKETRELAARTGAVTGDLAVRISADEGRLVMEVEYQGKPIELYTVPPRPESLLDDEQELDRLTAYLVSRHADRIHMEAKNDRCRIRFIFEG